VKETGQRVVILFEGRDAAGKGGTIKRFMEHLNPRGAHVVALEKPSDVERGQWYFQRYIEHLPTRGEIVLFDRSWYNRAGVERVMGFCTDDEYLEFMRQAPEFERNLTRSGLHLIKFWFSVSRKEQRRRFKERKSHPLKQWKLSPVDLASLDKWEEYTRAKEAMFFYTDTADAPWTVIKSDCKKRARLNAMRYVLHKLPYANKDLDRVGRSTRCWSAAPTWCTSAARSASPSSRDRAAGLAQWRRPASPAGRSRHRRTPAQPMHGPVRVSRQVVAARARRPPAGRESAPPSCQRSRRRCPPRLDARPGIPARLRLRWRTGSRAGSPALRPPPSPAVRGSGTGRSSRWRSTRPAGSSQLRR